MQKEASLFSRTIQDQKYAHIKADGTKENWEEIASRVAHQILRSVGLSRTTVREIEHLIAKKKFLPGGRYLANAGKPYHQVQNCLLLRVEDSREGWAEMAHKSMLALSTGAGIGGDYSWIRSKGKPIRRSGGLATGPIALMQAENEIGRAIMQGGSRRSAIWAGLNWAHSDIFDFISLKNWIPEVRELKERDFSFPATMDMTNISVLLDDEFFKAFHNEKHAKHSQAQQVYWAVVKQMLKTGEPGFSIDVGKNKGETLRNACVSGDTEILTKSGYKTIESLHGISVDIWNGFEWSKVTPKITGHSQPMVKVTFNSGQNIRCTLDHKFVIQKTYKISDTERVPALDLAVGDRLIKTNFPVINGGESVEYAYTQGFVSGDGMNNYQNMLVYNTKYCCLERLSGIAGAQAVGSNRVNFTMNFTPDLKTFVPFGWDVASRIDWFAGLLDSDGTELKEGGLQVASVDRPFLIETQKLLATLGVASKVTKNKEAGIKLMPDGRGGTKEYPCQELYRILVGSTQVLSLKSLGLRCERLKLNKLPNRDASVFTTVTSVEPDGVAETVYCFDEPLRHLGCFNGVVTGQCTEITSADDSDICNLGSINLAKIESIDEMKQAVELATAFLLAGTVYSDVPYAKVDQVRTKNRRLGLGLMGIHEWLLKHGHRYAPCDDLVPYLEEYAKSTEYAHKYAEEWDLSPSIKTRAIAPTGTIGIIGETTTGIEPVFCVAYKRRYLKHTSWNYQYVIDPAAQRLIEAGINPEQIEDAYSLAEDVERRVTFQTWIQKYVDHAISSTINLPAWGSELNNADRVQDFGNMLIKHLPELRGLTCYPDGARGGQPLVPVKYATAVRHTGQVFEETADVCDITKGGSCGD